MSRENRAAFAKKHVAEMNQKFSKEIEHSISSTKVFGTPNAMPKTPNRIPKNTIKITVLPEDTVTALMGYEDCDNLTALNFASYKNPGGGFLGGSLAQEEALCSESTLYNVLSSQRSYYEWNRKHLNKGLYTDRALFSPDVIFERGGTQRKVGVITCAAPNFCAARRHKISYKTNLDVFKNRINFMLDVAESANTEVLILGAWGCGVFCQNADDVAEIFLNELKDRSFSQVVFAVPSGNNNIYSFLEAAESMKEFRQHFTTGDN